MLMSTNAFGSPDLDLRPPGMQRDTMNLWVQECPACGYVSADISDAGNITKEFLKSKEYRKCDGIGFTSDLAARFYKYHKVNLAEDDIRGAAFALLHAAWACDDERDTDNAKLCRGLTLPLLTRVIEEKPADKNELQLMKVDILRRAGHFRELLTEYKDMQFGEDVMDHVLAFQLKLAEKGDTGCYRVVDAMETS